MNNREIAAVVWLAAFLAWTLRSRDVRSSLTSIIEAFWGRLAALFGLWTIWIGLEVTAVWRLGVWRPEHVKDVLVWFLTSGLVLFGAFNEVRSSDHFLRRRAIKALEIGVFLEAFVNLYVFPLAAELALVPLTTLLVGVSVVAAREPDHALVKRFVDRLLMALGFGVMAFVAVQLVRDWDQLQADDLVIQVFLPIALTIGALPFLYSAGLYATYELAFTRIDLKAESTPWHRRARAKLALLAAFHFRAHRLGSFTGPYQVELGRVSGFRDAWGVIERGRQEIREREKREQASADRLRYYAGVSGVDDRGRRLDRREFIETRAALKWLAVCMWGWYRRSTPGRYPADLVERFNDDFASNGLPGPAGVHLRVTANGQKWMAWRQTISGWHFAIGGVGPPPNEWHYDGPEPPRSFPPSEGWFDDTKLPEAPNWKPDDT
jgi:hypothetical protein